MGFGLGGNVRPAQLRVLTAQIPIDAAIALEFLPKNRRFLLTLLSLWQPVGVVVCTIIACVTRLGASR